jgi:serine/threonine protein kinase
MAPERSEDRPTTPAVDTYSLAGVLYEALTGQPPFKVSSMEQVIAAHLSSPPPQPSVVNPRVPAAFDDVIARGMAKDPDDRYGRPRGVGPRRPTRTRVNPVNGAQHRTDRGHPSRPRQPGRIYTRKLWAHRSGMASRSTTLTQLAATLNQPGAPVARAGGDHRSGSVDLGRHRCRDRTARPAEHSAAHRRCTLKRLHGPDPNAVLATGGAALAADPARPHG